MPTMFTDADAIADDIIRDVGRKLVVGLPLGLGKANHIVNALYARAVADRSIDLTFFSALTLEKPKPSSLLEARFITPSAMYRLRSKAKVSSGKGARISLGRAETLERVQRRRFPRVQATLPVAVAAFSTESRAFVALEGLTIDLSAGGLSLLTTTPLPAQHAIPEA